MRAICAAVSVGNSSDAREGLTSGVRVDSVIGGSVYARTVRASTQAGVGE